MAGEDRAQRTQRRRRPAIRGLVGLVLAGLWPAAAMAQAPTPEQLERFEAGDPEAPIHTHMAPHFLELTPEEINEHIPNVVTAVLASYRGYDTFGEATVVFTAAVGVLLLLGGAATINRKRPGGGRQA